MLGYAILNDFIPVSKGVDEGILALVFIGALVGVIGVFWTLLIPEAAVLAAGEEAAAIANQLGLGETAIARVVTGLKSPFEDTSKGAAIYGSIPGALITASASVWSKIVANNK